MPWAVNSDSGAGKRILLLSFYFEPDIGPGPFRNTSLANKLLERLAPGDTLEVITTLPNRYASFSKDAPANERRGAMTIHRVALPAHRSGMKDQAKAFLAYARAVRRLTRSGRYDLVFASSSRLMTAALASRVAKRAGAKLYLDIRDIFTETMQEVLAGKATRLLLPIFERLERKVIRQADVVNLVSPGFLSYFRPIHPHRYRLFTNGIDSAFTERGFEASARGRRERIILYAGNMGDGQGLHRVIPEAARALRGIARFRLVGDGGRRTALEQAVAQAGVNNVEVLDPVPRAELCNLYADADVLFLHLNDYQAFHRVLPSKLFEYGATGKPVLAGVAGCAADFTREEIPGSAVFSPCDAAGLVAALAALPSGLVDRSEFVSRFKRENIMAMMADDVLATLGVEQSVDSAVIAEEAVSAVD